MLRRLLELLAALALILGGLAVYAVWSARQPPLDVVEITSGLLELPLDARFVEVEEGVRLHVVLAGPESGPPVVLLHGFPEFWYGYARVIGPLAAAGFRVIVPDQRGYDLSDKPPRVEDYRIERLADDVTALASALGYERFDLVGHDWGGAVAWSVATRHPERIAHLAMFNSPHPLAWRDLRAQDAAVGSGITYRDLFQIPVVPELFVRFRNWRALAGALVGSSRPGTFSRDELLLYRQAWAQPGAIHAMVNWYRAGRRFPEGFAEQPGSEVQLPVRVVWGMKDAFFDPRLAKLTMQHCPNGTLTEVPDAGHWILHEEPELAARAMLELFRSPTSEGAAGAAGSDEEGGRGAGTSYPGSEDATTEPDGRQAIVNRDFDVREPPHALFLRSEPGAEPIEIYPYGRSVDVAWSGDGRWLLVTDHRGSDESRCVLVEPASGRRLDVLDAMPDTQETSWRANHHVYAACAGWTADQRVDVVVSGHGERDRGGFRKRYRFDPESGTTELLAEPAH